MTPKRSAREISDMPLLDHFRPPLRGERRWKSFHSMWAGAIANQLNRDLLPPRYFAEVEVDVTSRVEVDVGTVDLEYDRAAPVAAAEGQNGGTATLTARPWAPPAPEFQIPAVFPDTIEVLVYNTEAGPTVVAAVELVSPRNKDRPEARRAFAAKCAACLQQGLGLVTVDVVTERRANLHNELIRLLEAAEQFLLPEPMYAVAYRPFRRPAEESIHTWPVELRVGDPLPTLPLALDKGMVVPLDLEASYTEARQRLRLP
jgi:hypothetical protein